MFIAAKGLQSNFNTKILQPFGSRMQSQNEIDRNETK